MAVPSNEHERTLAFAEIALQQIRALRLPASPRNFEIWYQYATGYSPDLNRSINDTLAQKGALDESDIERIYDTHLSPGRVTDRLDSVGSRMAAEITQVLATIDAAAGSATSYSASLADASEELQGASSNLHGVRRRHRIARGDRTADRRRQGDGDQQQKTRSAAIRFARRD